ncbi:MAG TPA: hypothetical protein VF407_07840 [Polyangiaceae bacterium]
MVAAADAGAAKAALANARLGIVALEPSSDQALELVAEMKKSERASRPPPYLVLLANDGAERALVRAYEAGIDADLRRPFGEAYFLARIGAVKRLLEPGAATPAAPPLTAKDATDACARVHALPAWTTAAGTLASAASRLLSVDARLTGRAQPDAALDLGAAITLTEARLKLELRIAAGTDLRTAKLLAVHMVGPEAAPGFESEVLAELVNVQMGALKGTFARDGVSFTSGLPTSIAGAEVMRPPAGYLFHDSAAIALPSGNLIVHYALRALGTFAVPTTGLREGMVLVKSVFNPKGVLLLKAGTALSQHMIDRLWETLPPKDLIEVTGP